MKPARPPSRQQPQMAKEKKKKKPRLAATTLREKNNGPRTTTSGTPVFILLQREEHTCQASTTATKQKQPRDDKSNRTTTTKHSNNSNRRALTASGAVSQQCWADLEHSFQSLRVKRPPLSVNEVVDAETLRRRRGPVSDCVVAVAMAVAVGVLLPPTSSQKQERFFSRRLSSRVYR